MKSLVLAVLLCSLSTIGQTPTASFIQYKLDQIGSILVPSTMEVQAGAYKTFSDTYSKKLGYEISGNTIIFQQKGLNEFKKVGTYARVMIETTEGKAGDYRKLRATIRLTPKQLKALNADTQKEVEANFKSLGGNQKILKWEGTSIVKVNGRSAIKIKYTRQLNENPPVCVEIYLIDNYDRQYMFTLSYREEDALLWKDVLTTTKDSLSITNVR